MDAEGKISPEDFQVRFFGGGILTSLLPAIRYYHLEKVVGICGLVPFKESIRRQTESTVLLLLGWSDPKEKGFYTAKGFEYLGARRPILSVGLKGDVVDELLKATGAGVVVSEVNEIKAVLSQWMKEFRESGEVVSQFKPDNASILRYARKQQAAKLAQLLEEVSGHQEQGKGG